LKSRFNYRPPVAETHQATPDATPLIFALQPPPISRAPATKRRQLTGLEPVDMEASFGGGTRVQLRSERGARWSMWIRTGGGSWVRRKDFASPSADHACRTAEEWYGPTINAWHAAEESE
jgi:hypothetical protein